MTNLRNLRGPQPDPNSRVRAGKRPPPIKDRHYSLAVFVADQRGITISEFLEKAIFNAATDEEFVKWFQQFPKLS